MGSNSRNAPFVLPLARQIGILVHRHGIRYEGTGRVNTHSVASTTFLCGVATTVHATLRVRRRKRASVDDSIAAKAFYSIPSALLGRKKSRMNDNSIDSKSTKRKMESLGYIRVLYSMPATE